MNYQDLIKKYSDEYQIDYSKFESDYYGNEIGVTPLSEEFKKIILDLESNLDPYSDQIEEESDSKKAKKIELLKLKKRYSKKSDQRQVITDSGDPSLVKIKNLLDQNSNNTILYLNDSDQGNNFILKFPNNSDPELDYQISFTAHKLNLNNNQLVFLGTLIKYDSEPELNYWENYEDYFICRSIKKNLTSKMDSEIHNVSCINSDLDQIYYNTSIEKLESISANDQIVFSSKGTCLECSRKYLDRIRKKSNITTNDTDPILIDRKNYQDKKKVMIGENEFWVRDPIFIQSQKYQVLRNLYFDKKRKRYWAEDSDNQFSLYYAGDSIDNIYLQKMIKFDLIKMIRFEKTTWFNKPTKIPLSYISFNLFSIEIQTKKKEIYDLKNYLHRSTYYTSPNQGFRFIPSITKNKIFDYTILNTDMMIVGLVLSINRVGFLLYHKFKFYYQESNKDLIYLGDRLLDLNWWKIEY